MTFDEALKAVKKYTTYDITGNYDDVIDPDEVKDILRELKDTYAPTVYMTKKQYLDLVFGGKGRGTAHDNLEFIHEINLYNDEPITIEILMGAFAHPETIKIVDKD